MQILGAAAIAFSQGIAYFHAGVETLRSKSLDGNSFDSGDWFNRIDWTLTDNGFRERCAAGRGRGARLAGARAAARRSAIKPAPADIRWTHDAFRDLLRIRASSTLFRLRTAADVGRRLRSSTPGRRRSRP